MLGRVPLFPCFLQGNATPTIPHKLRHLKGSAFQYRTADAAAVGGATCTRSTHGCGSLGAEGLGWGGLSVSETEERRDAVNRAGSKRGHETRLRREAAARGDE